MRCTQLTRSRGGVVQGGLLRLCGRQGSISLLLHRAALRTTHRCCGSVNLMMNNSLNRWQRTQKREGKKLSCQHENRLNKQAPPFVRPPLPLPLPLQRQSTPSVSEADSAPVDFDPESKRRKTDQYTTSQVTISELN